MPIQPCLHPTLLADVSALNRRFIGELAAAAGVGRFAADPELARRLAARLRQVDPRWPDCPFLLYRLVRSHEAAEPACLDPYAPGVSSLVTVTLGFVWQLAREQSPAARAVTGADEDWCDALGALCIAQLPLLSNHLSLRPRLIDVPGFWQDLARHKGISALQRASLGATGMQLIHARNRRARVAREWSPLRQTAAEATAARLPTRALR